MSNKNYNIVLPFYFDLFPFYFGPTEPFPRLCRAFPSNELAFSFDSTELPSPQRNYSEPSLSQRRALAISITSPRQLVESKGTVGLR